MRYLTAIPVFLCLFLLDILLTLIIIGLLVSDYPFSYRFATKIWCKNG